MGRGSTAGGKFPLLLLRLNRLFTIPKARSTSSLNVVILGAAFHRFVALQDAPRVGIHHKNFMISRVQQNSIGCLGPTPFSASNSASQLCPVQHGEHLVQRSVIAGIQKRHKAFQPLRLLPEVSRGRRATSSLASGVVPYPGNMKKIGQRQVAEGALDILP